MTQKELLYIEDVIGNKKNIISIVDNIINNIEDENLVLFLEKEVKKHKNMHDKLVNILEDFC